jgi:hypothetical protein
MYEMVAWEEIKVLSAKWLVPILKHKKNGLQNAARFVITVDRLAARDVYCAMVIFFT